MNNPPGGALFVGAISGTSVDGLDLALLRISGSELAILHATTVPMPTELTSELLALGQQGNNEIERLGAADAAFGAFVGHAIVDFLKQASVPHEQIVAIGSHGQTVRHRPPEPGRPYPFTLQIGDPSRIAEITSILTVADFRRRDVAAGGQGAPLVPPFHDRLFGRDGVRRAIANIGGISNLSTVGAGALAGFDTGPGNALMDAWYRLHHKNSAATFDKAGGWGASGIVNAQLLRAMMQDPFLKQSPPKSTGKEHYNHNWLHGLLDGLSTATPEPADVQATLLEFTARTLIEAANVYAAGAQEMIVCGGGRLNTALMTCLSSHSPIPVSPSEAHGVDGDAIEAAAFAWLAHQCLHNLPGNHAGVTGAAGPRVLGAIYPA